MTMNLKNEALQKLYDTLVNSTISMSPYADSPIDKAFAECDDQLSESVTFEHIKTLQNRNDVLEKSNATLLGANLGLASTKEHLEKDLDDAKKQLKYFTLSRDDWRSRAKYAEKEVEELKKELHYEKDALVTANADRTNLQEACDKLSGENKKLKARTDCLRYEVEWYRKHYKEQSDKIKELKSTVNSMCGDEYIKKLQDSVSKNCYDQGQTDLWVALQNVNDSQPFELATCFPDVTGMEDILSWDLEDFLDAYKKWQEEKEKERLDHMRDYLARFCEGRVCEACPLESNEYKCGCGYSFKKATDRDVRIIPDEELERYYEKARGCGAYNLKDGKLFIHDLSHPMAGVNEAIKNACERFTKAVEAANINISTRAWHGDATAEKIKIEPWSCTLERTINVEFDRDLLEKVCGVKLDDK